MPNQGDTVESRHHHVRENEIRASSHGRRESIDAVIGAANPVSLIFEQLSEEIANRPLIVYDKNQSVTFH